ncbi:hypothetical protein PRUPE_4G143200 [Prunus persica]|uniref:Prolamin-like domain-containing protein n=1 Tax=Prunus persica TaxID=3760 RepID=M5WQ82_PRUPE|nr:hypothetical protein PRUPE_4G143200 [Prunus persica]
MAALNMFSMLAILLLASPSRMIFTSFAIPTLEESNLKTLDECKKHISNNCAREVGGSIFEGGIVTDGCCYELVSVGKTCHDLFFNSVLTSKPIVDKSRALAESTQVWDKCVEIIVSPAPSIAIPTSKALNSETLVECKHISINCAWQVGGNIFEGGTVTSDCCDDLLFVGKNMP